MTRGTTVSERTTGTMRGMVQRRIATALALLSVQCVAAAQDSVAIDGGGNDALSAQCAAQQRARYVVDLTPITSSWGTRFVVGPALKASRDLDPMFHTNILGSNAISPTHYAPENGVSLPQARDFLRWTQPGRGVHPVQNIAPPQSISVTGYGRRFGVAFSDFALGPNNVVGAVIGQNFATRDDLRRLFVERTTGASSRQPDLALIGDTFRASLGGVDHSGMAVVRLDNFVQRVPTLPLPPIFGENIVGLDLPTRDAESVGGVVNTIFPTTPQGDGLPPKNASLFDPEATVFAIDGSQVPLGDVDVTVNTPVGFNSPDGQWRHFLALDFKGRLTLGTLFDTNTQTRRVDSAHRAANVQGLRGNISYSPVNALGGNLGTGAALGVGASSSTAPADRINVFALNADAVPVLAPHVAPGTAQGVVLASPISTQDGAFQTNSAGAAAFTHWLGSVTFLGPSGQVGIGRTFAGELVLAATAKDPEDGEFIAVATRDAAEPHAWSWRVAAHVGMNVRSGPVGADPAQGVVGQIVAGAPTGMSSPAVDLRGNVYFTARWLPTGAPSARTGLFRAVRTPEGYQLEILLSTEQYVQGQNSGTQYVIESITLAENEFLAPGSFHAGSVMQSIIPGRASNDPRSPFSFGGAVVNATIAYQRGVPEKYEVVLFVGPDAAGLLGDINGDGVVDFDDLSIVLGQFGQTGQGLAGDVNGDGIVNFDDLSSVLGQFGLSE